MKRARRFHRHTPGWCWAVLAIAAAAVLPGKPWVVAAAAPAVAQVEKALLELKEMAGDQP